MSCLRWCGICDSLARTSRISPYHPIFGSASRCCLRERYRRALKRARRYSSRKLSPSQSAAHHPNHIAPLYAFLDQARVFWVAVAQCHGQHRGPAEPCYTSMRRSTCCLCRPACSRWYPGAKIVPDNGQKHKKCTCIKNTSSHCLRCVQKCHTNRAAAAHTGATESHAPRLVP